LKLTGSLFSLVLVFVPFTLAASEERSPSIIIGEFNNKTGDTGFDNALKQGLAMELGQSPFLDVLSDREVGEALLQMGRATTEAIRLKLRQDVCLRTGSKALIGGAIRNLPGERYSLELTTVACNNGDTLVKDQRDALGKNGVLTALHQAASELRMKLGESAASVQTFDVPAQSATTSIEALGNYGAGIKVRREGGDTPAVPYLKRAIDIDPNFPLPYAELTAIYRNFRQPSAAMEYARKAYRLRDRVSEREKLKISGLYYLATGDLKKEIRNYELWQNKYLRDFQPYNNLGNDYAFTRQLEKSLPE
jgi:eukaryotic-like serine/threonine-protein kinase